MKGSFRAIRVKSRKEFEWLIEHVTDEAFRVCDHWESNWTRHPTFGNWRAGHIWMQWFFAWAACSILTQLR